ncbi:MAG: pyridoxamine 5'-phosphate oxidase family protein [Candidatus Omnitrophota bacterium]
MMKLEKAVVNFFHGQRFNIVTTVDKDGYPHNSCKGIVDISEDGVVYLLDLYMTKTYENLLNNPNISVTAVDEHKFIGYSLKGKARIIKKSKMSPRLLRLWEKKITGRITHRLLKNLRGEKGHLSHPEALLPSPEYVILVETCEVVNLASRHAAL